MEESNDDLYEIDLTKYNIASFYEEIVKIVSSTYGWVNYQKGVFDIIEERDYCIFELEEFIKDMKMFSKALRTAFPKLKLTDEQLYKLRDAFLEITHLNLTKNDFQVLIDLTNRRELCKEIRKRDILRIYPSIPEERLGKMIKIDNTIHEIIFGKNKNN